MLIEKKPKFVHNLISILLYISQDNESVAKRFELELNQKIENLVFSPRKFRASIYFEDDSYRDMIYKGYTIIYKIESQQILILDIFKWQER